MKKTLVFFLIIIFAVLYGCGTKPADIDISSLADSVMAGSAFSDELAPADSQIGCYLYGVDPALPENSVFLFSSGATAEELAAFKMRSAADAETVETAVRERISAQRASFADYNPDEVPKLDRAVVKRSGVYVVLCVAADSSAAESAVDAFFR
ncbi:MAG: DUF4358 domain-containing protein [Oscillospiraceae bacterium]|jgi:hypothetical protein|nr:DUF4358 domain-containing protein [Oscillospiraceae bacterium]